MARPIKQTVDYFPHDADASEGRTLTILFNNFGHDGISCWWQLLERVSKTNNHVITLRNSEDTEYLAAKLHFKPERLVEILNKMASLDAIDAELWRHKIVWCDNLVARLKDVYTNRRQDLPSKPTVSTGNNPITTADNSISTPQNPTKETKLNKTILYEQFEQFWTAYPKKRNKGQADKAFNKVAPSKELMATILDAIKQAKKTPQWLKDSGEFIPYPATWLNAKGWEDEFDKPKPTGSKWG